MNGRRARVRRNLAITGAVVVIVNVTCVSPLPLVTWVELSAHVLKGGQLLGERQRDIIGKLPPVGDTSRS